MLTGKDRKIYDQIIEFIDQKNYAALFEADMNSDSALDFEPETSKALGFGLSNQKYVEKILDRIAKEISDNIDFLIEMNNSYYKRANYFNRRLIEMNPKIIETFIEKNFFDIDELISLAIDNGYMPSDDYIASNVQSFSNVIVMKKLLDGGYRPTNELMETSNYMTVFSKEELFAKALDWGYVPSLKFLTETKILNNPNLAERILDTIELTPEIINSPEFFYNRKLHQKIIDDRPDLISEMSGKNKVFWIEAFKQGHIPEEITNDYFITADFLLFSKIVKQKPEMIKYCQLDDQKEKEKIDELALCMGYIPSIDEVQNNSYIQSSPKLMEALILKRPEAIKYIETRSLRGEYSLKLNQNDFLNLARLALNNGYIPTLKDLEQNPRLADSYDIMKYLIQENPESINMIRNETPNKEELLKIAIANGFNGTISSQSRESDNSNGIFDFNLLLITETAIMYQLDNGQPLDRNIAYDNSYSINLYNYFINNGYQIKDIIRFFNSNEEVMEQIISNNPEYVTALSNSLSRKTIDKLGLLAIEKGYTPKIEDEIFGYGSEIAKVMVKKYPSYLRKVKLMDPTGLLTAIHCEAYDEICKTAIDAGFVMNLETDYNDVATTYSGSYDIMQKAIQLEPRLIEYCSVENKEKYDELCRLAISYGYEATDNYVLEHRGQKLCSNYDIMSKYISKHPYFIMNVEITNSDEMSKLIDIAINSGLKISSLSQKQLFKLFLSVDESKWNNYLDAATIDSLRRAKTLHNNNSEISETINPKFLSENIIEHFTKSQIEILSCYPNLQEKILELSSNGFRLRIIYELADKYKDNLEWIPILEKSLDNINSFEYANLLNAIEHKELAPKEKDNLMLLLMTDNHLDISSYEELVNLDSIRKNYIDMLIERNTLYSLKTAYFEKTFGIDLMNAINLVHLYGGSLENKAIDSLDESQKSEFTLLKNMKEIINLNDINVLKYYLENINPKFVVKPDLMITYEARLKYLFTQELNKSFSKPSSEDKVNTEQDFDVYLAAGHDGKKKCRMMITSIGAYTAIGEPDDYYASWNMNKIASHGCCCSYIGEKNLGTAEVKYCCLGFTDYELGSLQISAPYDLCSMSTENSYKISSAYSSMYLLPDDILNYTRHTHNETVMERRNISYDAMFKKQPSYIVYFADNFEDRLTNSEAMKQWESVKKAAANFSIEVDGIKRPLPIMVVEREKIAKSQLEVIQGELDKLKMTFDSKLIKSIISDYESNYAGNREYHLNISEKCFPKHEQLSESVVGKIIEIIETTYSTEPNIAIECIDELEKAIKSEEEKYNNTQHGLGRSLPSFNIEEALSYVNKMKSKFKLGIDSTLAIVSSCDTNERQFNQTDASNINQTILDNQLSSHDVIKALSDSELSTAIVMYEDEIKEEKINSKLKVHNSRHVKNVMLYSTLIGQSIVQNRHDLNLLMLSAKYHDIGRKTDAYEEHATSSAKIVAERLKDKYSADDLAVVNTIIEFHEIPRDNANADRIFNVIAEKNGISDEQITRVRQMAEVLKDADALDRTRFLNKARLNPEFLQYDISKKLIKFAATMQETYAINDLKEFHCDEAIELLLQDYTPQEIIRTIRHCTRGTMRKEDIQSYINTWAMFNTQKNSGMDSKSNEGEDVKYEGR